MQLPLYTTQDIRLACRQYQFAVKFNDAHITITIRGNQFAYKDDVHGRIDAMNDIVSNFGAGREEESND